jgi:hypothetical protein
MHNTRWNSIKKQKMKLVVWKKPQDIVVTTAEMTAGTIEMTETVVADVEIHVDASEA